jgi:nicotinamidase-related amidase
MNTLSLNLRRQTLRPDAHNRNRWQIELKRAAFPIAQTAVLLCDVWDKHWCRGANERLGEMLPRMNRVVSSLRTKGVQILHAPSETMDFYADSPARKRMLETPKLPAPTPKERPDPPMPVDSSDGGSDTFETSWFKAWSRQHPGIEIDPERDAISDDGLQIYSFCAQKHIENLLVMGVHTNMCILNRTFGIKQMVRWGMNTVLIRDLTDTMYNPALAPYVNHEEGTRLVVEYIEKFWCPTVESKELV